MGDTFLRLFCHSGKNRLIPRYGSLFNPLCPYHSICADLLNIWPMPTLVKVT